MVTLTELFLVWFLRLGNLLGYGWEPYAIRLLASR